MHIFFYEHTVNERNTKTVKVLFEINCNLYRKVVLALLYYDQALDTSLLLKELRKKRTSLLLKEMNSGRVTCDYEHSQLSKGDKYTGSYC